MVQVWLHCSKSQSSPDVLLVREIDQRFVPSSSRRRLPRTCDVTRRFQRVACGIAISSRICRGTQASFIFSALTDPKYVPVRVPHVHLADVPRHVSRWESDVQPGGHAVSVNLVDVVHPHRHPHAPVDSFVSARSKRGGVRPLAAAPLSPLAEKDLAFARPDRPESPRRSPVPALPPAQLLEPCEARGDVGYFR
jgi:hypothetical protein